jgi:hypothetical protein
MLLFCRIHNSRKQMPNINGPLYFINSRLSAASALALVGNCVKWGVMQNPESRTPSDSVIFLAALLLVIFAEMAEFITRPPPNHQIISDFLEENPSCPQHLKSKFPMTCSITGEKCTSLLWVEFCHRGTKYTYACHYPAFIEKLCSKKGHCAVTGLILYSTEISNLKFGFIQPKDLSIPRKIYKNWVIKTPIQENQVLQAPVVHVIPQKFIKQCAQFTVVSSLYRYAGTFFMEKKQQSNMYSAATFLVFLAMIPMAAWAFHLTQTRPKNKDKTSDTVSVPKLAQPPKEEIAFKKTTSAVVSSTIKSSWSHTPKKPKSMGMKALSC